jgi:hypothetical protein
VWPWYMLQRPLHVRQCDDELTMRSRVRRGLGPPTHGPFWTALIVALFFSAWRLSFTAAKPR